MSSAKDKLKKLAATLTALTTGVTATACKVEKQQNEASNSIVAGSGMSEEPKLEQTSDVQEEKQLDQKSSERMAIIQESYEKLINSGVSNDLAYELIKRGYNITEEEKERYYYLYDKTVEDYKSCKELYESFEVEKANITYEKLLKNEDLANMQDIIFVYAKAVNNAAQTEIINDYKNYKIEDGFIIIDNVKISSILPQHDFNDYSNTFVLFNCENQEATSFEKTMFLISTIKDLQVEYNNETNEAYAYTMKGLRNSYNYAKGNIESKYEITSWYRDPVNNVYVASDVNGNRLPYNDNSEIGQAIKNCVEIKNIVVASDANYETLISPKTDENATINRNITIDDNNNVTIENNINSNNNNNNNNNNSNNNNIIINDTIYSDGNVYTDENGNIIIGNSENGIKIENGNITIGQPGNSIIIENGNVTFENGYTINDEDTNYQIDVPQNNTITINGQTIYDSEIMSINDYFQYIKSTLEKPFENDKQKVK